MNFKILVLFAFLASCSSNPKQRSSWPSTAKGYGQLVEKKNTAAQDPDVTTELEKFDWEAYQDSLRKELIKSKTNSFLIGSLLEELYIRNLISVAHHKLNFNIPLDLHSFDCGAPDCYSTDLEFSFPHNHELIFPAKVSFTMHEHGCVDPQLRTAGTMKLVEQGTDFVNYYSAEHRSHLVILGADERQEYVYYFTETAPNKIKAALINKLLESFQEDDANEPAPYRSTLLVKKDYMQFLHK